MSNGEVINMKTVFKIILYFLSYFCFYQDLLAHEFIFQIQVNNKVKSAEHLKVSCVYYDSILNKDSTIELSSDSGNLFKSNSLLQFKNLIIRYKSKSFVLDKRDIMYTSIVILININTKNLSRKKYLMVKKRDIKYKEVVFRDVIEIIYRSGCGMRIIKVYR